MTPMKMIIGTIAIILILIFGMNAFTTVEAGHRGVKLILNEVQMGSLPAGGPYWYNPFTTRVVEMDVRVLRLDGETAAYTKDVQTAAVAYTLNFRLNPEAAPFVFSEYGTDWETKLVGPVVTAVIKNHIGQHRAEDIIGIRGQLTGNINDEVRDMLQDRSISVIPGGFQMSNIDYTDEFEDAVEAKVVAEQRAVEERNRTEQIKEQAIQKIEAARAEAESIRIRAKALEQNAKLVEWEAVQKWDGKMPTMMLGSGATPFIQIPAK